MPSRRTFIKGTIATGLAFGGLAAFYAYRLRADRYTPGETGYGPLVEDPAGVLSLPRGFRYRILSTTGEDMADGLMLPGHPDAMAAFPGPDGKVVVVRNHELTAGDTHVSPFGEDESRFSLVDPAKLYDVGAPGGRPLGGTTTFVFDPESRQIEKQFLSLGGTLRNCAGGATPWGSWLTCEETTRLAGDDRQKDHGYIFEVPARADGGLVDALPLVAMGRFQHEAAAVDPKTGIVYMTEDQRDSLFYRFRPDKPGDLAAGGRLQALAVKDRKRLDTTNHAEPANGDLLGRSRRSRIAGRQLAGPRAGRWRRDLRARRGHVVRQRRSLLRHHRGRGIAARPGLVLPTEPRRRRSERSRSARSLNALPRAQRPEPHG